MSGKIEINSFQSPEEFFDSIAQKKVLVIGDVMIDSYLWGKVDRISPEAPVPIVLVENREKRLGGAANVALNIQALGASPFLCSIIGNDKDGEDFLQLLVDNGLSADGIAQSESRPTTIKHRILSGGHQMLRVDSETDALLNKTEYDLLIQRIEKLLPEMDAIIFEDYDKGVISSDLITKVVESANKLGIPTIVDPKKRNFLHYKNVSLFKPNKKELKEGLKLDLSLNNIEEVGIATSLLKEKINPDSVLITLSEQGVYMDSDKEKVHVPAHIREICDVSGAGDTVISVAALCYVMGLPAESTAALSNLAGGIVCEQVGVVPIDKETFIKEIKKLNLLPLVSLK